MKQYLEPLAIATNVTQSSFCTLDDVLLTFGRLHLTFTELKETDEIARRAVLASLEKRWSKADQAVFIAAVILNPFYRTSPFAIRQEFNLANVQNLMTSLWKRFFRTDDFPDQLNDQLIAYWRKRGMYQRFDEWKDLGLKKALKDVRHSKSYYIS